MRHNIEGETSVSRMQCDVQLRIVVVVEVEAMCWNDVVDYRNAHVLLGVLIKPFFRIDKLWREVMAIVYKHGWREICRIY